MSLVLHIAALGVQFFLFWVWQPGWVKWWFGIAFVLGAIGLGMRLRRLWLAASK